MRAGTSGGRGIDYGDKDGEEFYEGKTKVKESMVKKAERS